MKTQVDWSNQWSNYINSFKTLPVIWNLELPVQLLVLHLRLKVGRRSCYISEERSYTLKSGAEILSNTPDIKYVILEIQLMLQAPQKVFRNNINTSCDFRGSFCSGLQGRFVFCLSNIFEIPTARIWPLGGESHKAMRWGPVDVAMDKCTTEVFKTR